MALEEVKKGNLPRDEYTEKFSRVIAHVCLFEDDSKYFLKSVRLNNKPYQKKKKYMLSETLLKGREIWRGCGNPRSTMGKRQRNLGKTNMLL